MIKNIFWTVVLVTGAVGCSQQTVSIPEPVGMPSSTLLAATPPPTNPAPKIQIRVKKKIFKKIAPPKTEAEKPRFTESEALQKVSELVSRAAGLWIDEKFYKADNAYTCEDLKTAEIPVMLVTPVGDYSSIYTVSEQTSGYVSGGHIYESGLDRLSLDGNFVLWTPQEIFTRAITYRLLVGDNRLTVIADSSNRAHLYIDKANYAPINQAHLDGLVEKTKSCLNAAKVFDDAEALELSCEGCE